MARALDRNTLLDAFDEIGRAAVAAGTRLSIAVFGGSALMLASNFRFSTEDVDIAAIGENWPPWLSESVERIARRSNWSPTWLNDAVAFHLSSAAQPDKLKALRVSDFHKGAQDDVASLLRVLGITQAEPAIDILAEFFPKSAADADKQHFVLKRILSAEDSSDAPEYPRTDG